MQKSFYKSGMLLVITAALISFTAAAQEVTKEFHKEYNADKNTTLDMSNKYGDILVTAWDKDQVVIDVRITVRHPDRDRAEKYLKMINVEFSEEPGIIRAKTIIDDGFNFSGWGNSREFKINYTVHMPYVTSLNLANRYGNTDVDELRNFVNLDIKYGNLEIDKLTRGNEKPINKITIAYGKATITEANWLEVYARYTSNLTLNKSTALLVDTRYSKVKLGETSSLVGEAKYDTYNIEKINNMVLMSGYTTVSITNLSRKLNYEASYGSISVENIPPEFETIDLDIRYTSARLGLSESASFNLDGVSRYGSIKFNDDNFRFQKKIIDNTSSEISGVVGKDDSPSSKVKISTAYGSVKLF